MLKTIRKTIVGMMNQLRIARSLMPRRGAAGAGREVTVEAWRIWVDCGSARHSGRDGWVRRRDRAAEDGRAAAPPPHAQRERYYFVRPYFLKVAVPVLGQAVQRFLGRALAADDERMQRLLAAVSSSAYSGTAQKSFTMNIDW